ncbi:MAG: DUF262 domain-containing protein [Saprospiraceae bacterium]|nr:DUF262 domain-containing protein [Saprospiraceae bacterium]MBP6741160.1 DUF262 domain-containing protein [Leptospiraceae bacterium]
MEEATLFTPEYKVVNDLFGDGIKYTIPSYQRPYSWECVGKSDKNNQVNVMWEDLIEYYESNNSNPYFLGSMVLIGSSAGREFQVIDGQQRMTTLVLLLVAIKCFLNKSKGKILITTSKAEDFIALIDEMIREIERLIYNRKIQGAITIEKKVKIEKSFTYDYDSILTHVIECKSYNGLNLPQNISDEQKQTIIRYFNNAHYLEQKVTGKFLENGSFTELNFSALNNFIEFLKNRVAVVRILASKFDVAYQIFEILNNRGLPLSNKDLLRNFIISEFSSIAVERNKSAVDDSDKLHPDKKWEYLERNFDLDNEFISRFVESINGKNQKYSAFNDLKEIYLNKAEFKDTVKKKRIELFYEAFSYDLANYTKIINTRVKKIDKNIILFILNSGNVTYSINLLLALYRNETDESKITNFLKTYERYLIYLILGPARRFVSSLIYNGIKYLNSNDYDNAIKEFSIDPIEKNKLANYLDLPLDNYLGKLLISKYVWILDTESKDDTTDISLNFSVATLEHIIPQTPDENTNWKNDFSESFRKEFTYRLGNMTLLTQSMNSAAKNYDFSAKKILYAGTKLKITNEMVSDTFLMNEAYIKNRHDLIKNKILNELNF